MLELRPYQEEGRDFLQSLPSALLLDEPGLGKTPQFLTAVPRGAPAVIVAPAVVKGSWHDECRAWRPDLKPVVLQGRGSFRWPEPGELIITNYEVLPPCRWDITKIEKRVEKTIEDLNVMGLLPFDNKAVAKMRAQIESYKAEIKAVGRPHEGTVLGADEAHRLKSNKTAQAQRFRAMRRMVAKKGGRSYGLTATPLLNRPLELWNLLTSFGLHKEAFGSWHGFLRAFGGYKDKFGHKFGDPRPGAFSALGKVAKRRLKRVVLAELPAKQYQRIPVEIDRTTRKLCDRTLEVLLSAGVDVERCEAEALRTAEAKIGFEEMSRVRMALAAAKLRAALELVPEYEESDTPLLFLSDHKAPVEAVGSRDGWAFIHGGTPQDERPQIVRRFQAGELKGIALTIRAGGIGITLTRASNVLRIDRNWTPALNEQAEDRVHRIGQSAAVLVKDLVADHVLDQRMHEVCMEKSSMADALNEMAG